MSKNKNSSKSQAPKEFIKPQLPEGFVKRSDDLIGFWQPELGPIDFVPREAMVKDSKLEPEKQSGMIVGELYSECSALLNADGEPVVGQPGDRVAVWAKPGMRELRSHANTRVILYLSGEKDTGKPNAMALFDVCSQSEGDPLPVQDMRKQSVRTSSWLAGARA